MKILFVNYEYPPLGGGGGVACSTLARHLAARGHEIHVLTSGANDLAPEESREGVRIHRVPVWGRSARSHASFLSMLTFWPLGIRHGRPLVGEHRFDVVNSWFAVPSGPAGLHLARTAGCPHIVTLAGGDIYDPSKWYTPDKNPLLARIVRWVLKSSAMRVAVSHDLARRTQEIYRTGLAIEVVSLGMRPPELPAGVDRSALGLAADRVYLLTIGRLVRRKNLAHLIRTLATVERRDLELLVLGEGPERQALSALAHDEGLAERVHFLGFVEEDRKRALLKAADIFVLPSLHEAFGLVYLEGMHAGLPVIAARPGGQEDFLTDGETGYLVAHADRPGLAEAIADLADHPDKRRRMGERAREVARRFTAEATADGYERLFNEALRQRLEVPATAVEPQQPPMALRS